MAAVNRTTTWSDNQVLTSAALNGEFDNLLNSLSISNADIASDAAIAVSKIATGLSGSLVGTTDTQSLSNKTIASPILSGTVTGTYTLAGTPTLTSPTITKPTVNGSIQAYTSDDTGNFDLSASNIFTRTLDGSNGSLGIDNVSTGQVFTIVLLQDGSGSRTVTWFSTIKWPNATAPTLTTTASRYDVFSFIYTGSVYLCVGQIFNLG